MVFKTFFGKKEEEEKQKQQIQNEIKPKTKNDEPPPATQLENAMIENARNDSQETRSKVYQELLFSDLLLSLVDNPPDTVATPSENPEGSQNLNVAIMSNPQGIQFAAAFTSAVAAKRWRIEGGQYVSIRGQDIFKLLEASPADVIVINPGSAPFIALNKPEYIMLAQGTVPQSPKSPVQVAPANQSPNQQEAGMQISFPPDAFNSEQKNYIEQFLLKISTIEAAALGALLPPNSPNENNWLRTIFLRTKTIQKNQEEIQKFCIEIRDQILKNSTHFSDVPFEVGIMPDINFWIAINQNKFTLFDKNPPKSPAISNIPPVSARKA